MSLKERFGLCAWESYLTYYVQPVEDREILIGLLDECVDKLRSQYPYASQLTLIRLKAKNARCLDKNQVK